MDRVSVIIPTLNAEKYISQQLEKICSEAIVDEIILIDSGSNDKTTSIASHFPKVQVIPIPRHDFDHGRTRNLGAYHAKNEILVYMTQDAMPFGDLPIETLVKPLIQNKLIGMAYGRQIPYDHSNILAKFARYYNYPAESLIKSKDKKSKFGIKTVFTSNSYAAYKKSCLSDVGFFPNKIIFSEDVFVAAKMIQRGLEIAYVAESRVLHSHDYTIIQEFKRYFDIGVFYGREKWITDEFSNAEKEGLGFIGAELKFLVRENKAYHIPSALIRDFMKYLGYRLGNSEKRLPLQIKKKISMHPSFWS